MNFTLFIVTFLAIVGAAHAGNPQNAAQLSSSTQDDQDVVLATPAPTIFADIPTPAPTNFSDPTPAPTYPTAAPTESADSTPSEDVSQSEIASQSATGVVGVAYSSAGTVGVAYSTTRAEYEADQNSSSDSGSSYTVPIVVVGCLIGVLGAVAAVVVIRKRKAAAEEVETDYSNAIRTPAV